MTIVNDLDLDSLVLAEGKHDRPEDGMCILEAVAFIAGEPFSDHPACASQVIGAFLRSWNDCLPDDERQQLKRYIPLLVGSAAGPDVEARRAWMATDWLVRVQTPAWLRLAGLTDQAAILEAMPEVTPDTVPSIKAPLAAIRKDARAAAWDAAGDAAWAAAGDAAWKAAGAAAWDAAGDAARDAAWAAAGDAAWKGSYAAAGAALNPTKVELQAKAHELVERMLAVSHAA